jgi:hypothetical protein
MQSTMSCVEKQINAWDVAQTVTGFFVLAAIFFSWIFTLSFINRCRIRWDKQNYRPETFVVTGATYNADGEFGPDYHLDGDVAGSAERMVPRLKEAQEPRRTADLAKMFPVGTKVAVYYNPTATTTIVQNESLRVLPSEPDFWKKEDQRMRSLAWRVVLPIPVTLTIYLLVRIVNFRRARPAQQAVKETPTTAPVANALVPELRRANQFSNRVMIRALIATALGMAGGALTLFRLRSQFPQFAIDSWIIAGAALFFSAMFFLVFWTIRPGRFECPQCQAHVPKPTAYVGPLQYHCMNCDILWDTGIKQWSGGDGD